MSEEPILKGLAEQILAQNLILGEAGKRVGGAAARRGVVAGDLYPQSHVIVGLHSRSQISNNTANFFDFPRFFESDLNVENRNIGLAASWKIEF